ncbi:hypothetical protein ACFVYF_26795 [Streptomyces sp. NPDC058274]|uniref:terpene synthase family protein n=1 Tax=Streptomyces sp. NPDC058274 TaxID=3346416 RepID=UPI0036E37E9E
MQGKLRAPLALPQLSYPFASEISPHANEVDAQAFGWARQMNILDSAMTAQYSGLRVGRLAGRTSPRSERAGLQLLADWQLWLFAFDDAYCDESATGEDPELLARTVVDYLRIIEDPGQVPDDADPFMGALADLRDRLLAHASPMQWMRFVHSVTGYFLSQCWEAANRSRRTAPTLVEYLHMRRHSGAVPTCMALIDVAGGFVLPQEDFANPHVMSLAQQATNIACWANDILSYPKEVARSRSVHSLPPILSAQYGIDMPEALHRAGQMHDHAVRQYLEQETTARAHAGPQLHRYLDDLRFWMTGNLDWSLETRRYNSVDALDEVRPA